jgi:hypothetical protein
LHVTTGVATMSKDEKTSLEDLLIAQELKRHALVENICARLISDSTVYDCLLPRSNKGPKPELPPHAGVGFFDKIIRLFGAYTDSLSKSWKTGSKRLITIDARVIAKTINASSRSRFLRHAILAGVMTEKESSEYYKTVTSVVGKNSKSVINSKIFMGDLEGEKWLRESNLSLKTMLQVCIAENIDVALVPGVESLIDGCAEGGLLHQLKELAMKSGLYWWPAFWKRFQIAQSETRHFALSD